MTVLGERIGSTVDSMRQRGYTIDQRTHKGDIVYVVAAPTYHLEVTVNPQRWVGLHFGLGSATRPGDLSYDIDTQLYDLAHPRFDALALAVEGEIVAFLEALAAGHVRLGRVKRRAALLLPVGKRTMVVTRGRLTRSVKVRRAPASIAAKGGFVPLA